MPAMNENQIRKEKLLIAIRHFEGHIKEVRKTEEIQQDTIDDALAMLIVSIKALVILDSPEGVVEAIREICLEVESHSLFQNCFNDEIREIVFQH